MEFMDWYLTGFLSIGLIVTFALLVKARMDLEEARLELWLTKDKDKALKEKINSLKQDLKIEKMSTSMAMEMTSEIDADVKKSKKKKEKPDKKPGEPGDGSRWDEI